MAVRQARLFASLMRQLATCVAVCGALGSSVPYAHAVVKIFDGFGDADRNNDGQITGYDTDLNDNGTLDDPTADAGLIARNIHEVSVAQAPADVGVVWSGIRSFDTAANLVKSKLRIIDDSVVTTSETATSIHNDGYALGVESSGGGSSFIGRFGQSIALGPDAGDKVVVTVDWRVWRDANNNASSPQLNNALRWGIFQDTDNEFGTTGPFGTGWQTSGGNGATVKWGTDDGKWYDTQGGAEGDKGIHTELPFGGAAPTGNARIRWEYNQAAINGTTNDGRILEGLGVSNTAGAGGDTGTIATPGVSPDPGDGPGGIITDLSSDIPHTLSLEIVRLADGLVEVASLVDSVEFLRDEIKATDTGFNVLGPIPFTYDYVAFRNATNDWDYVIDNFKVEIFGSNANVGVEGDYDGNGKVDAADYVLWRNGGPLANEVADIGTVSAADYDAWRARFGNTSGSGSSGAVPEPGSILLVLLASSLGIGFRRR